jgi:hypothetical protein
MSQPLVQTIPPSPERVELRIFALWLNRDCSRLYPDCYLGAAAYFAALSAERKRPLHQELRAFLDAHINAGPGKLKSQWLRLTAQPWQEDLNIREVLEDFCLLITDTAGPRAGA